MAVHPPGEPVSVGVGGGDRPDAPPGGLAAGTDDDLVQVVAVAGEGLGGGIVLEKGEIAVPASPQDVLLPVPVDGAPAAVVSGGSGLESRHG